MTEITEAELGEIEALFVQTSSGFTSTPNRITLQGVSPSTLYFSDRPKREVGHISSQHFVDIWGDGENSFEIDPPNAVISFLSQNGEPPADAVVVITDPQLDGDSLSYAIDVLDGTMPAHTGPVSLFIDPMGRPLSPGSVAGVRRRERRRR